MGLSRQARLLENVCSFAANLRSHSRSHSLRPASTENETINIQVTLSSEEFTDAERQQSQFYKEFCTIFCSGVLNSAQRQALYKTFRDHIKNNPSGGASITAISRSDVIKGVCIYSSSDKDRFPS